MRPNVALLALGAATLLDAGACATPDDVSSRDRLGQIASAIQGGKVDPDHAFAVGVCGVAPGPGQCQIVCSGTLIAPNVVLTARHCVDAATSETDCATSTWGEHLYTSPGQYFITTSPDLYQDSVGWHRVSEIHTPTGTALCGGDLALLVLEGAIASGEATPATPAVSPLGERAHDAMFSETAIGYGVTSPGSSTEGTRHIRSGIAIQCIPGDTTIGCDPKLAFAGDEKEFLVGDGTCDGDSGSGAFDNVAFRAGSFVVLGTLSRGGVSADGRTCIGGVYTRLDVWRDFLVGVATDAAKKGDYALPAWTAPLPIPDAGVEDASPNVPPSSSSGCRIIPTRTVRGPETYSSVPYEDLALLILVCGALRRNSSRKWVQFRRAVGKKTGYC